MPERLHLRPHFRLHILPKCSNAHNSVSQLIYHLSLYDKLHRGSNWHVHLHESVRNGQWYMCLPHSTYHYWDSFMLVQFIL